MMSWLFKFMIVICFCVIQFDYGTSEKNNTRHGKKSKDCGPNVREQKLGTSERGLLPCIKTDSPRHYENGSEDHAVNRDSLTQHFGMLITQAGPNVVQGSQGPRPNRVKFWQENGNYEGMSNIQLHCDIKQDYNVIAQYLGAVIEIKQVGHLSYKPIVGVTKTGQLYWSTSVAWDKKYTNSMRPSYNYTKSRTGNGILKFQLMIPKKDCGKERGTYQCLYFIKYKTGIVEQIKNTLNLQNLQCRQRGRPSRPQINRNQPPSRQRRRQRRHVNYPVKNSNNANVNSLVGYFNNLNQKVGSNIVRGTNGPKENRVTFSKANGNYGGKSNIQLHCDIKQDYNDIAQYLGAVMEIKQVGHLSYKPILGVTTIGKLHWSTSLAWDKTYPNSMRPSYNYRMSRTGNGIKKFQLMIPKKDCGKERGTYQCLFYIKYKTGIVERIENTLNLQNLQCRKKKQIRAIGPIEQNKQKRSGRLKRQRSPQRGRPQRGRSPQRGRPQRGRSPQRGRQQRGRSSQRGRQQRGRSPQRGRQQRGRSPQRGRQQRGRSPQRGRQQRGRSPQRGRPQRGRSPQRGRPQRGRSPQRGRQQRGRSPQRGRQQRGRSPQRGRPQRGRSPQRGRQQRGRSPQRARQQRQRALQRGRQQRGRSPQRARQQRQRALQRGRQQRGRSPQRARQQRQRALQQRQQRQRALQQRQQKQRALQQRQRALQRGRQQRGRSPHRGRQQLGRSPQRARQQRQRALQRGRQQRQRSRQRARQQRQRAPQRGRQQRPKSFQRGRQQRQRSHQRTSRQRQRILDQRKKNQRLKQQRQRSHQRTKVIRPIKSKKQRQRTRKLTKVIRPRINKNQRQRSHQRTKVIRPKKYHRPKQQKKTIRRIHRHKKKQQTKLHRPRSYQKPRSYPKASQQPGRNKYKVKKSVKRKRGMRTSFKILLAVSLIGIIGLLIGTFVWWQWRKRNEAMMMGNTSHEGRVRSSSHMPQSMSGQHMGTTGSSWNTSGLQSASRGPQSVRQSMGPSTMGSPLHHQSVAPSAMGSSYRQSVAPPVRRQSMGQSTTGSSARQSVNDNKEYENSSPFYNPDININKISVWEDFPDIESSQLQNENDTPSQVKLRTGRSGRQLLDEIATQKIGP